MLFQSFQAAKYRQWAQLQAVQYQAQKQAVFLQCQAQKARWAQKSYQLLQHQK
jgi:hypothetical protein